MQWEIWEVGADVFFLHALHFKNKLCIFGLFGIAPTFASYSIISMRLEHVAGYDRRICFDCVLMDS